MADVAPCVADHLLGDPFEQGREDRQRDVGPDPALGTMIDRAQPESAPSYDRRFRWCRPTNPTMTRSFCSSHANAMRIV